MLNTINIINLLKLIISWVVVKDISKKTTSSNYIIKCNYCGSELDIEDVLFRYVCNYCGNVILDKEQFENSKIMCRGDINEIQRYRTI